VKQLTIGILGGMGPRATVEFEQRLLGKLTGVDQQLPRIVATNDGTIPDRSDFLLGKGPDPLPRLLKSAKVLMAAGSNLICMPCNTAHADQILGRLQQLTDLPIVDMPAAAVKAAKQAGYRQLLILGTEGTKVSRVFDMRAAGLRCVYPNQPDQTIINSLITQTKQGNTLEPLKSKLAGVIRAYNSDAAILACTELSLINPCEQTARPIIDALDELVKQCILQMNEYNIN